MSILSVLQASDFRRYFIASCFATMAVWMTRFLFGWLVWNSTESFFWVGIASMCLLLPALIVTPIFGVVADRINLRIGLLMWQAIQCVLSLIAFIVFSLQPPSLTVLLFMVLVFGCASSSGSPFRLSTVPRLVNKELLPNAVGLGSIIFNLSRILAPALAASLLTFIEAKDVFLICTFAFGCGAFFNSRLPNLPPAKREGNKSNVNDFTSGLSYAWQSDYVRLLLIVTLINSQIGRALMELLPALSGTFTDGQPADLAVLTACAGAGSIIGSFFIAKQKGESKRLIRLISFAMMMTALAIFPIALIPNTFVLAVLIGLISLLMTVIGTGSQISIQLVTEDAVRGRVLSLWLTIAIGGPSIGAFIMGAVADFIDFKLMLAAMLLLSLSGGYWLKRKNKAI